MAETAEQVREAVRRRYAAAATRIAASDKARGGSPEGGPGCCAGGVAGLEVGESFGPALYSQLDRDDLPVAAVAASLGCGNPTAVADLRRGERVLDLGSGGGIDVLLSARRVGPDGFAYGVDMTTEMLDLARANAARAGATNVEFLQGTIEEVPLPDASVDVVISNCVINLAADKSKVLAEIFRVLVPGGRIGVSDVVAEDQLSAEQRAERGEFVGCVAGALSRQEYLDGLAAAGFVDASVEFTHPVADQMHAAVIRAVKPAGGPRDDRSTSSQSAGSQSADARAAVASDAPAATSPGCCSATEASSCCAPEGKADCCHTTGPGSSTGCGCR